MIQKIPLTRVRLNFYKMALIASSCLSTSFEIILLDCILTAVLSACIKKKKNLPKWVNFCVGIEGEIEGEKEAALLAYYALLLQEKKDCN